MWRMKMCHLFIGEELLSIRQYICFKIQNPLARPHLVEMFVLNEDRQVRMKDCQHVEEDKVLVTERQLFVVAKVAQENAAQVGVHRFRRSLHFRVKDVENLKYVLSS